MANAAITVNIKAPVEIVFSHTEVFESGAFGLRKTNPPGGVEFVQISGTDATVVRALSEATAFMAPALEFDGSEQLSFEATVTGPNGETASIIISNPNVVGRAGAGIPVMIYDPALSLKTGFGFGTVDLNRDLGFNSVAVRQSSEDFNSDKIEIAMFGGSTNFENGHNYDIDTLYQVEGVF